MICPLVRACPPVWRLATCLGLAALGPLHAQSVLPAGQSALGPHPPALSPHPIGQVARAPRRFRYDLGSRQAVELEAGAEAPLTYGFDNTCSNGSFFYPDAGSSQMDWGVYAPLPGEVGLVYSFEIGYVTSNTSPVRIDVGLWEGTLGTCTAGDAGSPLGHFSLTGLPASTTGMPEGFLVTVNTRTAGLVLPAGAIGWDYEMFDDSTGPMLTDGPLGTCGSGSVDMYDEYVPAAASAGTCAGTLFFGGCAPVLACASFYLGVVTDDGSPPGSLTLRSGCSGLNALGAMVATSGPPSVSGGGSLDFTVDPSVPASGAPTLAPGTTLVISWLATGPDIFTPYPCGTPLTGLLPPYYGELLISILGSNPIVQAPMGGALWGGTPVPTSFPIPANTNFVGVTLYLQSSMTDIPTGDTVLTDSWDVTIGP